MNRMQKERIIHCLFVAVMCAITPWVDAIITDIRLVDGPSPNEGRLEVSDSISGWGTVCSTQWDILDTMVVCRELGFPGANSFLSSNSPFGQSTASILISHVECNGTENSLIDCTYNEMITRCTHQNDVGIICHKPGYIGCFGDSFDSVFKFSDAKYSDYTNMTIDSCLSYCRDQDLQYAGLEYTYECYCVGSGAQYDAQGTFDDSECQNVCSGNTLERCGGLGTISIFDTTVGFCEDPGEPNYGSRQGNWFRYGASVTFDCEEGYNLTGNQSIQCLGVDGSLTVDWNADTPMCLGPTVIPTTTGPSTAAGSTTENTFTTGFFTTKITAASTAAETPTPFTTDGTNPAVATASIDPMTSFSMTTEDLEITATQNADSTTEAITTNVAPTTRILETTEGITTNVAPTTRSLETTDATATLVTSRTDSVTTSALTTVDVITSNSENGFTSSIDTTFSSTEPLSTSDVSSTNVGMTSLAEKTEIPPTTTTTNPDNITGTLVINTEVTTPDTTDTTAMATSTEGVDTTQPPLDSTQATPTTPSTTNNATPHTGSQGGGWPWPPLGIGLLLGGIILGLLLIGLVICLLVISPRAKAKKEEEEAVRLRNARQSSFGNSYSPDIILDRNGRRSYRRNEIESVEDSETHDNGAFLPDDASIIGVYGERQRAVENPYATFPADDTSKKTLFADTARKLNQIYVPGSPNDSIYSRGTHRSSSDRFGAQLVV